MASFLFGTMPFVSHLSPMAPIVREVVSRGHRVRWYTSARFRSAVEATGATLVPLCAAPDFDEHDLPRHFPELTGLRGLAKMKTALKRVFLDAGIGQLEDLRAALAASPADVVAAEVTFPGVVLLHETGGPPYAVVGILPLGLPSRDAPPFGVGLLPSATPLGRVRDRVLEWAFARLLFRDVTDHLNGIRARLGLPPARGSLFDTGLSPFLWLQCSTEAFEYPRSDLPPQVHYIGPVFPDAPGGLAPPPWWDELQGARAAGRGAVLVTQGTVSTDPAQLLLPALRGLAAEDALVVATTGRAVPPERLGAVPENARLAAFVPYGSLLPHVDAMVTNGGYGGVQLALAHGVPLVVAGRNEDKPEVAARVAWCGAGIDLKTDVPSPRRVRDAVRRVRDEPGFRAGAQRVRTDFARHHAPAEAADLLERLARTGKPVLRHGLPPATYGPVAPRRPRRLPISANFGALLPIFGNVSYGGQSWERDETTGRAQGTWQSQRAETGQPGQLGSP